MVAAVRVNVEGLGQLTQQLVGQVPKQLVLGVSKLSRGLNATLQSAIIDRYHVSASSGNLNSVLQGSNTSNLTFGKFVASNQLVYDFKPIALSKFPVREVRVSAKSRFAQARPGGGYSFIKKDYALAAQVKVLRRRGFRTVTGRKGFGGFLIKPTRAKSGKSQRRGIYERQQSDTWLQEPFKRAPIKPLFGPSLSQMVGVVINKDPKVQKYLDNAINIIIKELEL